MKKATTILIIGIGNSLRSDDGIGAYVCACLEALALQGVSTQIVHQLQVELVPELLAYDSILFVDATVDSTGVQLNKIEASSAPLSANSHHVNAPMLIALATQLYHKPIEAMMCTVQGESFEMGNQLSHTAKENANDAIQQICHWIEQTNI